MWADYPIFGGYDDRTDIAFNSQNLINLFLISDPQGKKKLAFLGTPGLGNRYDINDTTAQSRAIYVYQDSMYGVFGQEVYRITAPLVKSKIGTIATSKGYVSITANNGGQVIFVDGINGYIYNTNTNVFSLINTSVPASSGFPGSPANVAMLDGYFVVPDSTTRTYQISAINDGTKWDPLDRGPIESYPGVNVGVGVVNQRLFFFKTDSTEVWYDSGAADFPFRRDNNLLFNFGCISSTTIQSGFGILFWLARDREGVGSVMMTEGQNPRKISNESVDNLIAGFSAPQDSIAYIYKDLGHIFYVITWTTDDVTLVYDATMQVWHKMEMHKTLFSESVPFSGESRHLSNCHAYFNNKSYIGSYKSSTLYEFSRDFRTNDGEEIRRVVVTPHFFDENYRMRQINWIQIDMQMGIGLSGNPDPGTDPKLYLRISRDGGNTFGNYHGVPIGKIGDRRARVIFWRKGICRDLVSEISFYDPVIPVAILGGSINYDELTQ